MMTWFINCTHFITGKIIRQAGFIIYFILYFCSSALATHLVGGSITYKYLGKSTQTGYYNYLVRIEMFRDCSNGNQIQFSGYIIPGVYERAADTLKQNYYNASGDSQNQPIFKIDEFEVYPPAAAKSCAFAPTTCIREGIYEGIIALPSSNYGYYLFFQTCCRNTMVNVPGVSAGQDYFAIVPPTATANNTPVFNAVPSPYICVNDTVSLLYSASEPDGDSLVYTLSTPYGGGNSGASPTSPTSWPRNTYPNILPTVPYNFGYSVSKPFGSGGYVFLDKYTGILTMYATSTGRYALAVDVHEYRGGKEISVTRRDVQIIVISCPYRQAPKRVAISDSLPLDNGTPTTYNIQAGERIAFNLRYQADKAGVSVFTESGFFDKPNNLIHQPEFKYSLNNNDVTAYFSWQTTCKDASNSPYTFTITVADTGCPPKTAYQGINIYVIPFIGVRYIYGPNPACQGVASSIYTVNNPPKGDSLFWKVTGGSFFKGPNDSSITVNWGKTTTGYVEAVMHSQYACGVDTLIKKITVNPKPIPPAILGAKNPCAGFTNVYSAMASSGSEFFWKANGGTITSISDQTKTISIKWLNADSAAYIKLYSLDPSGCFSDTALIKINVAQPLVDSIFGSVSVCPNAEQIDYWVNSQPGAIYHWAVIGGTQVSGGNSSHITVNWGSQGGGFIKLNEVTSQGCAGDTITLKVLKDYYLYTSPIVGDSSTCEYLKHVPYSVTRNRGSVYKWEISGGSIASGNGTSAILVDWDSAGPGALMVTETAYDSINHLPCKGIPVSLNIDIHKLTVISPISGPKVICEKDSAKFNVTGNPGGTFVWKINGAIVQNVTSILTVVDTGLHNSIDTLQISAAGKSVYGCLSPEQKFDVAVFKLPVTSPISGPAKVCAPNLKNRSYSVSGFSNSTYKWVVDGGTIVKGDSTNNINVNWNQAGIRSIRVQEINALGCPGPVISSEVQVDSLSIDLQVVSTNETNDRVIDITWHPENTTFLNGYYKIYKEQEGQSFFNLVDSINEARTSYEDSKVNTAQYSYRYIVTANNSCGAAISSLAHRSIRLAAVFDGDSLINSNWNTYAGWPVSEYDIMRTLNKDTTSENYGFTQDSFYAVIKSLDGFQQCIRIMGKENGADNFKTWSNKVCIDFDPVIWIPDIFTPHNGDMLNNTFHIFAGNYSSFNINIYNRWGEHIFSSDNPTIQWDGTYKGVDCTEGVYLYMLTVKGAKENIYRSGTVELER